MKKNNKIGFWVILMLIGTYTLIPNTIYAEESSNINPIEQNDIKATKETLEKAKDAMSKKDYQSAIVFLTAYIQGKPKKYEPYKLRGESFYALHQFRLAENDFQTAINIKTADDKFITGTKVVSAVVLGADKQEQYQNTELGNLYGELMYAQKALNNPAYETSYQKAFEYNSHIYLPKPKKEDIARINCPQKYGKTLNPQGVDADISAVINDIENEDFYEAAYRLSNITTSFPKYYYGHYLTGVVMAGLDQEKDAISSFEKALKYNPYDFESLASLGQIYYNEAEKTFSTLDAKKSIEYFEKALKYNPNCYMYYFYIGLNNLLMGNNDIAISNFDSAIKNKSNDYNSMYYKAIALYLRGDYGSTVDGTTNLIYKHVSNYNSVMYLRALAYYKLGKTELAVADIEKIFSGMNDIYNADIKTISEKEKTLESYLYLLKAQILEQNGEGTKADLEKAYSNPIIKALSSNQDYNLTIPAYEFENQYDYMRTAFSNKYNIAYTNPDYKISNKPLENIPEKGAELLPTQESNITTLVKTEQKNVDTPVINPESIAATLASGQLLNPSAQVETKPVQISMRQSLTPEETLPSSTTPSIAELLATQSIPEIADTQYDNKQDTIQLTDMQKIEDVENDIENVQTEVISKNEENTKITQLSDVSQKEPLIIRAKEEFPISTDISNEDEDEDNANTSDPIADKNFEAITNIGNSVTGTKTVISAPIQRESDTFNITYDNNTISNIPYEEPKQPDENDIDNTLAVNPFETMDEPIKIIQELSQKEESEIATPTKTTIKTVAKEIKDTPDFKISYDNNMKLQGNNIITNTSEPIETVSENTQNIISLIPEIRKEDTPDNDNTINSKTIISPQQETVENITNVIKNEPKKIVEKYADVNLSEFNIQKRLPVLNADDEIIVFEPESFITKVEENFSPQAYAINTKGTPITDNFSQFKQNAQNYVNELIAEIPEISEDNGLEGKNIEPILKEPQVVLAEEKPVEQTIEAIKSIVPTIRTSQDKEEPSISEISTAQNVNSEMLKQDRSDSSELWNDIAAAEVSIPSNTEKEAENNELLEFLNDSFDQETVLKAKTKKEKKLKKRTKKEQKVASIINTAVTGDTTVIEHEDIANETTIKTGRLFRRSKSSKKATEASIKNTTEYIRNTTEDIQNISTENTKKHRTWFHKSDKNTSTGETQVKNTMAKEKKNFKWWRKKEKQNTEVEVSTLSQDKTKTNSGLKSIFKRIIKTDKTSVNTKSKRTLFKRKVIEIEE